MEFIKAAVKGIIIGIANVIPGVSGGTMMVSMGVYDTLLGCITDLFKQFGKSVKTLLPYVLGALVGIVALASVLTFLFENYPLPTSTAFIGLILGGISPLLKKIEMKKANVLSMLLFLVFLALIVTLAILHPEESGRRKGIFAPAVAGTAGHRRDRKRDDDHPGRQRLHDPDAAWLLHHGTQRHLRPQGRPARRRFCLGV